LNREKNQFLKFFFKRCLFRNEKEEETEVIENKPIDEEVPITEPKIVEQLPVPPPVENNNTKRRTTRRTTTRLFRECQNGIKMR